MLIGGYQPFSLSDYPGKTAAIIFTQGCNFRCPYCHNRQLWATDSTQTHTISRETVIAKIAKRKDLLGGVVVTGGEPTLQKDLDSFLAMIKQLRLPIKLDTNGSRPQVLKHLIAENLVDYIAMDIKAPMYKYDRLSGCAVDWHLIRKSIDIIRTSSRPHHFRTTYDTSNLSDDDIEKIRGLIVGETLIVQDCLHHPDNF